MPPAANEGALEDLTGSQGCKGVGSSPLISIRGMGKVFVEAAKKKAFTRWIWRMLYFIKGVAF